MPEITFNTFVGFHGINFTCGYCRSHWRESPAPKKRIGQPCIHRPEFRDTHFTFPLDRSLTACTRHEDAAPAEPTATDEKRVTCSPCRLWIGQQKIEAARRISAPNERRAFAMNLTADPNVIMVAVLKAADLPVPDRANWTPDTASDPYIELADVVTASILNP